MSSSTDSHLVRNLALLALLVTVIGTCIAAIALIPAFGQWLWPREPLPNPMIATTPAQPTVQPTLVVIEVHSDQDWQDTGTSTRLALRALKTTVRASHKFG